LLQCFSSLGLANGFVGAGAFAGAAIDAFIGVDFIGGFTGDDGAYRANVCAGTAGDAKVGVDDSRHDFNTFIVVVLFSKARR
jgi:hypothetical protein